MFRLTRALRVAALSFALPLVAIGSARAATLPALPAPSASFDAGILHVDRFGNGSQSLVLIPGLSSGPWVWAGTIARFASDYTIYVVTLPGFDGRPATQKTPLFSSFSADFWKMLGDCSIQKPTIVGHSIGGTLAILLGEQHPERLHAIVAVDGMPVFPMLANATPAQRESAAAQFASMYENLDTAGLLAGSEQYMSTIGTADPTLVAPTAALEAKSDPKAIAAWAKEDVDADLRADLGKLTIPMLELMPYNARDSKPPMSYSQDQTLAFYRGLLAGAPNVTVEPIAPARHFAMLDQPDAFYAALETFLKSTQ